MPYQAAPHRAQSAVRYATVLPWRSSPSGAADPDRRAAVVLPCLRVQGDGLHLVHTWMNAPHVAEFWEQDSSASAGRTPMVSDAARACADVWREFAEQLEQR